MIEIDTSIINRAELMGRINKAIAERNVPEEKKEDIFEENKMSNGNWGYIETQLYSLRNNIRTLDQTWYLLDAPLTCNRKFFGKPLTFFRRVMKWFMKPYLSQMCNFNGAVTRAISDMMKIQQSLIEEVKNRENV